MRVIRATLAYDGTDFVGWQVQATGRSVQGELMEGLSRMHGHPVRAVGAGRTDSGVHATGQVTSFLSDLDSIPGPRFRDAMNAYLPRDMRVTESDEAPPGFHARRSATSRRYRYYVVNAPVMLPHLRKYRHWVRHRLDLDRLRAMAGVILGEHDFTSFTAEGDANHSRVRTVTESRFDVEGETVVYTIEAGSFLWKMVRNIVGTVLWIEENGGAAAEIATVMDARSRPAAGPTAPANGLFLEKVSYEQTIGA
jgi:tRNA pseudouridine38-40 synthase